MLLFSDLMWFFKQEKKSYILGIAVLVLVAILNLIPPYIVGVVVDEVSRGALSSKSRIIRKRNMINWSYCKPVKINSAILDGKSPI